MSELNNPTESSIIIVPGDATPNIANLYTPTVDKTVANTTTETSIIGTGVGSLNLPSNFFTNNQSLRIEGWGYYEVGASTDLTIQVKFGSIVVRSLTINANVQPVSNVTFLSYITGRTTGVSGIIMPVLQSDLDTLYANTTEVVIDTTQSYTIDVTWTWSAADVDNTVTFTNMSFEALSASQ